MDEGGSVNDYIIFHYGVKRRSGRYPYGSMDIKLDSQLARDVSGIRYDIHGISYSRLTPDQAKEKLYKTMINDPSSAFKQWIHGDVLRGMSSDVGEYGKQYLDRLKEKGYDAIPDFNDNRWTDDPLYVFDRAESMKPLSVGKEFNESWKKKYIT